MIKKELYSCLLVGLGNIGFKYDKSLINNKKILSHAKAIFHNKNLKLVAGVDSNIKNISLFKKIYKVETFTNLHSALKKKPDIVIVATPTESHLKIIKILLTKKSIKTIICEKPFSFDYRGLNEILKKCKNKNINLFVNYIRISDPASIQIKNIVQKFTKKINGVCEVHYAKGFYNNCSHFFNLIEYWFGDFKNLVSVKKIKKINFYDYKLYCKANFEKAEVRFIPLKNDNLKDFIKIRLKNKIIQYLSGGKRIYIKRIGSKKNKLVYKKIEIKNKMKIYQKNFYQELIAFLNNKKYRLCSGEQALKTLKNMNYITRKMYEKN